jgi:chromate reductase, NAD(P)H dehydrogenase (quinone)
MAVAMKQDLKFLGFVGSLREKSFNRGVMRAAIQLLPPGLTLEVFEIAEIPPFNQDLESNPPKIVKQMKAKIRAADAILFVSPEYNYSIPGVLKNTIDWASRPYNDNAWDGKPVAVMSASSGRLGGARMQYHLRQSFVFLNMHPVNRPEFMLSNAAGYFDEKGNLTDTDTRNLIKEVINSLADWTRKLNSQKKQA